MKPSYDYSFATDTVDSSIPTIPTRSLQDRIATLAAHQLYASDGYIPTHSPSCFYSEPPYSPSPRFLLLDQQNREPDFQSNVWYQSTSVPSHTLWRGDFQPGFSPPRLTGLGIRFEQPDTRAGELEDQPQYPQLSNQAPKSILPPQDLRGNFAPASIIQQEIPCSEDAYSAYPSIDYVAHSPSSLDMLYVPYSPTDDALMLIHDTTPDLGDHIRSDGFIATTPDVEALVHAMESPEQSMIGIIPDINMRALAAQMRSPPLCVNPIDISGCTEFQPIPDYDGPLIDAEVKTEELDVTMAEADLSQHAGPRWNSSNLQADPSQHAGPRWNSSDPQADFSHEALSAIVSVLATSAKEENTINEPANLPVPPCYYANTAALGGPPALLATQFSIRQNLPFAAAGSSLVSVRSPLAPIQAHMHPSLSDLGIQRTSPVLNAHEGIGLDDLRSKADRFRFLNPGGMRFLRKNECKRHMSSHAGFKPYSCPICAPYQDKSFVRQDLLKRHMKVTHGIRADQWSSRRRKVKGGEDGSWQEPPQNLYGAGGSMPT
ncbi:hypothetical protein PHLCEN_2v1591 [Hermanssonia centrifuga]|uniref:C2H2-type domain-containing protein n=1 Tax=Hermanssonia centrifuga TaxID=98765 RepID=A0A2R6RZJ6_9APHY|nr:hypothetical protein PHLCEN_2v1591 [Hermanssonia centrifuga]